MRPIRPLAVIIAVTCTTILAPLGTGSARAETTAPDPLAALAKAAPATLAAAAQVPTKTTGTNAVDVTIAGTKLTVPVDPKSGISLGNGSKSISIGLPYGSTARNAKKERPGVVSYDNTNASTTVPVVENDGSVQINMVIAKASAPSRYGYRLAVPHGGHLVPSVTGGYFVVDGNNDTVAMVAAPWAKDANGAAIPTHYEVKGTTLTQVVEFTTETAFPVVADPEFAWYGILPSVKLNRSETKTATTLTGMATVCGWVGRFTTLVGAGVCGLNAASIIVNTQRIHFTEKRCAQLLIGPGAIGTIGYSGGNCK